MSVNLAFFNVETVNVEGKTLISEFAAIVLDAQSLSQAESFSTHVGVANANSSYPTFDKVAQKIANVLQGRVWVGYNLQQSIDQLNTSFADAQLTAPVAASSLDFSTLPVLQKNFPSGLAALAQHFGLGQPRQQALEDCRMMMNIFKKCALSLFLQSHLPPTPPVPTNTITASSPAPAPVAANKPSKSKNNPKSKPQKSKQSKAQAQSQPQPQVPATEGKKTSTKPSTKAVKTAKKVEKSSSPALSGPKAAVSPKQKPKIAWNVMTASPKVVSLAAKTPVSELSPLPPPAVAKAPTPKKPATSSSFANKNDKNTVDKKKDHGNNNNKKSKNGSGAEAKKNVKPLKTPWADLVAPARPKTELSFEKNQNEKKKKNNNNKKKRNKTNNVSAEEGSNQNEKKKNNNNNKKKWNTSKVNNAPVEEVEEGWTVSVSKFKTKQLKRQEDEKNNNNNNNKNYNRTNKRKKDI